MNSTEFSTDLAPGRARSIAICPRCGSIEIEPIKPLANARLRDAVEDAWSDYWAGCTGLTLRFIVRWVCVETANRLRGRHRCGHCGWGFRKLEP